MNHLRKLARDWMDGFRTGLDVLRWGQAYPRTISLSALRKMKRRPDEEPT